MYNLYLLYLVSLAEPWRQKTPSAPNWVLLSIHTLSIPSRNSIQGLGRRMEPVFRMGLFLSFFGRVYHPIFYISHQWKFRMTEIAQCVGVNASPGDWFSFISAEESRNLLSLEKWRNWNFPAKVDEFPSCSSHSWEALLLTFPCMGEALFCPYYQLRNKTTELRKEEERENLLKNIFKDMSFP